MMEKGTVDAIKKLQRIAKQVFRETVSISVDTVGNPDVGMVVVRIEYGPFDISTSFVPLAVNSLPDEVICKQMEYLAMDLGRLVFMKGE